MLDPSQASPQRDIVHPVKVYYKVVPVNQQLVLSDLVPSSCPHRSLVHVALLAQGQGPT